MQQKKRVVPLSIVMTYPVRWSPYQILRDFVQNFYDAAGYNEWSNKLQYQYKNKCLHLWMKDVSFHYEWLMHIGASTKTANSDQYAGYFGEGFKIAALCAYRDMKWKVRMSSGDWQLEVTSQKRKIDRTTVDMLAYSVTRHESSVNETHLQLENISKSYYQMFLTVLNSFYYPENTLMGDMLWESREGAVYLRSRKKMDPDLPVTENFGKKGAVFCGYQMLGTNPFPLVICLHKYDKHDRERRSLYSFEVIKVFESVCSYVDSKSAMVMLEKMRRYWNTYPHEKFDIHSWSQVIDILVNKVAASEECKNQFVMMHDNLLCLNRIHTVSERNRREQARAWLDRQEKHYVLVKGTFGRLGYPTLESECAKHGGFVVDDDVDDTQRRCFGVLEELCGLIFDQFFILEDWPKQKIITNENASYHGMAVVQKCKKQIVNSWEIKIKYEVCQIYLKTTIFNMHGFYDGVSTYVHELCHMFGGDSSNSFSLALTLSIEILIQHHDSVLEAKKKWDQIFLGC